MVSKARATRLFQEFGIEGLPATVCRNFDELRMYLVGCPQESHFVVRISEESETLNLPRLVDAPGLDVLNWVHDLRLRPSDSVIVQPYRELLWSAEIAIDNEGAYAELVDGRWELDSNSRPVYICRSFLGITYPWRVECALNMVKSFSTPLLSRWLDEHLEGIGCLGDVVGYPFGVKVHYCDDFGVSPQNIRSGLRPERRGCGTCPSICPVLESVDAANGPLPASIRLRLTVRRESAQDLVDFAHRLVRCGVQQVYLRSGVLGHFAIILREAGLQVTREDWN
jgi:hypothetical protein